MPLAVLAAALAAVPPPRVLSPLPATPRSHDPACCSSINRHRAKQAAALLNSSVALVADSPLHCLRTPVPSASCHLAIASQMLCCSPEHKIAEPARARTLSMDAVERDHCHCESPVPSVSAEAETKLRAQSLCGEQDSLQCDTKETQTCTATDDEVRCEYQCTTLSMPAGARDVLYALPGPEHARPLPAVLLFECWDMEDQIPTLNHFQGCSAGEFDANYTHANLTRTLLEAGFAVIAPRARAAAGDEYGTFWDTNFCCSEKGECDTPWHPARFDDIGFFDTCDTDDLRSDPPADTAWVESADDAKLADALFAELGRGGAGAFGPIDTKRVHAVGFSSGGYMASRLAASHGRQLASVAIHSAAYFYCPVAYDDLSCHEPAPSLEPVFEPDRHPPTLLIACDDDQFVDRSGTEALHNRLQANGVATEMPDMGCSSHRWAYGAVGRIYSWLGRYPSTDDWAGKQKLGQKKTQQTQPASRNSSGGGGGSGGTTATAPAEAKPAPSQPANSSEVDIPWQAAARHGGHALLFS